MRMFLRLLGLIALAGLLAGCTNPSTRSDSNRTTDSLKKFETHYSYTGTCPTGSSDASALPVSSNVSAYIDSPTRTAVVHALIQKSGCIIAKNILDGKLGVLYLYANSDTSPTDVVTDDYNGWVNLRTDSTSTFDASVTVHMNRTVVDLTKGIREVSFAAPHHYSSDFTVSAGYYRVDVNSTSGLTYEANDVGTNAISEITIWEPKPARALDQQAVEILNENTVKAFG